MEGFGRKVLRAIEGDEQLLVQHAKWVEQMLLLKVRKDLEKNGIEIAWRNGIEELTDLIVTRDRIDAEEGLGVIVSLPLFELALVFQKRGGLHKKDAKGT
jgi:hypothetical protein